MRHYLTNACNGRQTPRPKLQLASPILPQFAPLRSPPLMRALRGSMDPRIPVPTDNIYKFLATFGLVVMVVSLTLLFINGRTANQVIFNSAKAYYDLKSSEDPLLEEREKLLDRQVQIAVNNREHGKWLLAVVFAIGFYSSCFGFYRWFRKVQPVHDQISELQRQKLELEIRALNKAQQRTPFSRRSV